ncbi:factor-independent urate hydroxylase [Bacillus alkalicellulosilyticus]|uniref:factor-independent urate hydroxylase n=1 Tax=Alkalihalobacterium alkalicellulosilyticum TaxID=1912214 RepID=UPI000997B670|nr:urate oxidase [Bacillus alkalicellulosilyticus]
MKKEVIEKKGTMDRTMYYGKGDVFVYRSYATPLEGIREIPESNCKGRSNIILGMDIKVALKGQDFLTSFTNGDNSLVITTDSMKNFILRHAGMYKGSTMEGFFVFIGERFLDTYSHIKGVALTGKQIPFTDVDVPSVQGFEPSKLVFRQAPIESPTASYEIERTKENEYEVVYQQSGVEGLRLIKVRGSSFTGYIKDEYTTLREAHDRPLFIYLNIYWMYKNERDATGERPEQYVCAEQVTHLVQAVFHEANLPSIQNLIYHIGLRILKRFPQLEEVSFESNNRTWDTIVEHVPGVEGGKVYTDPRPPFGFQGFSMNQKDLEHYEKEN